MGIGLVFRLPDCVQKLLLSFLLTEDVIDAATNHDAKSESLVQSRVTFDGRLWVLSTQGTDESATSDRRRA